MNVSGIGTKGYGTAYAEQAKRRRNTEQESKARSFASDDTRQDTKKTADIASSKWNVTCSSNSLVLHGTDTAEDGEAVTAWANVVTGTSMTVYRPEGFDPQNPVYKVKMWDASGRETEYMVDISKVSPSNCNVPEMYAYCAHLSSTGECPNALENFLMAHAHYKDSVPNYGAENMLDKTNWLKVLQGVMEMQYKAGNLKGYMSYKGFLGFLMRKTSEKEGLENRINEESKVDTHIRVNADGSRILMMTRHMGNMATTTSVELSKPSQFPDEVEEQPESETEADVGNLP